MSDIYLMIAKELEARDFCAIPHNSHSFSDKFTHKMDLIIQSFDRPKVTKPTIKRIIIIAAIITALLFGALCASATLKKYFYYIIDHGLYSTLFYDDDNYDDIYADDTTPSEIRVKYVPSYIPEGYSLSCENSTVTMYSLEYTSTENELNSIHYSQQILDTVFQVNTENAEVSTLTENGVEYFCVIQDGWIFLSWTDDSYIFTLRTFGDLTKDEALKIAQSLRSK